MSTTPTRLRVAICGGGIGGLTLALALAPYADLTIDIYEGATRFEEIGAGLAIWGRAVSALQKLGLKEKLRTIAPGTDGNTIFEFRRADVATGGEVVGPIVLSTNLGLHRAQCLDLLVKLIEESGRASTHFRKRCLSFSQGGKDAAAEEAVTLNFADGTYASCDVLIGCDGIKSAVREELLRDVYEKEREAEPKNARKYLGTRFCGTVAYRALIKPDRLREMAGGEHPALTRGKMYGGKDKHIVTYPVGGGRFINLIAYSSIPEKQEEWKSGPWVTNVSNEEVLNQYQGWEPEAQALLKCVNQSSRWAMYEVELLPFWSKGRVTLLGDAAHAMPPFIGSGGGQVIEDVYVLSKLLGSPHTTRSTLPSVLRAYEEVRRPRANKVVAATSTARKLLERQEEFENASSEELLRNIREVTEWLWEGKGDIDDDVLAAETLVKQYLSDGGNA